MIPDDIHDGNLDLICQLGWRIAFAAEFNTEAWLSHDMVPIAEVIPDSTAWPSPNTTVPACSKRPGGLITGQVKEMFAWAATHAGISGALSGGVSDFSDGKILASLVENLVHEEGWAAHFSLSLYGNYFHVDDLSGAGRVDRVLEAWRRLHQISPFLEAEAVADGEAGEYAVALYLALIRKVLDKVALDEELKARRAAKWAAIAREEALEREEGVKLAAQAEQQRQLEELTEAEEKAVEEAIRAEETKRAKQDKVALLNQAILEAEDAAIQAEEETAAAKEAIREGRRQELEDAASLRSEQGREEVQIAYNAFNRSMVESDSEQKHHMAATQARIEARKQRMKGAKKDIRNIRNENQALTRSQATDIDVNGARYLLPPNPITFES